jgi:general secretion pathway protein G
MVARHRLVPPSRTSLAKGLAAGRTPIAGFTLVELLIVVAIIATLASIAVPLYIDLTYRARVAKAMADIRIVESEIAMFEIERTRLPVDLGEISRAALTDPWDNPYEYLSFAAAGPGWKGAARKDHSLVPLNSTYDLYSKGKDGTSASPLTAKASGDDIIRANDGGYIGLASGY